MYAHEPALIATPIGMVRVEGHDAVARVTIGVGETRERRGAGAATEAARQIVAFLTGELRAFDLPLVALQTPRGDDLRAAIVAIGYGETSSYGALARIAVSSPRAIGQACARNPMPLIVPCHRVLATNGPGQYSGGQGLATKTWLLDHERRHKEMLR